MMNLPLVLLSLSVASGADYPNQLAAVPPMGWNSWNCYGGQIDADGILAQAEAMVSSGLRDHGFLYLVIDDGWQGERSGPIDALQGDDGFPDMGELANQVRALGLRPGIYSTPWETSYQGREGSADYEVQDAWQFADWGYAYLKYDWHPVDVAAATRMRDALASAPRPLVYSLSNSLEMELAPTWASVANLWRTTFDITDNWDSMSGIGFGQDGLERYAGPGSWNDPDMMVLGYVGWGAEQHPTGLTADEQRTHVSLWALLAAPLMLGCDMTRLDEDTLALLTNDEVLAVDQDPAGIQGSRLAAGEGWEVWRKPLASGADAVGLFNRGEVDLAVQVSWEWLERGGVQPVRDLWDQADLGGYEEGFSATLPPHGARLLRVGEADPIPPALLEPLAETAVLGEPFGYTFLTSGTRPLDIQAEGLPAGLTLEGATLSGSPEETGSFQVVVGVSNEAGSTEGTLMLEVSEPVQDDDPRILLFSASELSLPPGQPGVLSWVAQGVDEVTLEPDLGSQPAEGSVTIAPLQTTTYTLSMEGGQSYALQVEVPQGSVLAGLSCPGRLRPTNPEDEWQGWGEAHEDTSSDGDPLSVGGTEALNTAVQRPPRSTEQLLHVDRYLDDDEPVVLMPIEPALERDWTPTQTDTLGEAMIRLTLLEWSNGDIAPDDVASWGGDLLQIWTGLDGADVVLWQTAWDSGHDAATFYGQLYDILPRPLLPGLIRDTTPSAALPRGRWWAGRQGAVFLYHYANRVWLVWGTDPTAVETVGAALL